MVEDDPSIREIAFIGLQGAGFSVTASGDGRDGLARARTNAFDAVLLDVMLPSLDGFEVCRQIRRFSQVPVVMLTARTSTIDVVVGLESGADDYVKKPFEMPELVARLRAVLRRRTQAVPEMATIRVGPLEIDPVGCRVSKLGTAGGRTELMLTATEFRLLLELAGSPGQVFSRDQLLRRVWDYDFAADTHLVDVAVQRLRSKVEDDPARPRLIKTMRGFGYRVDKD